MTEAFSELGAAVLLMEEALTMLDAPEAASAARLLAQAISVTRSIGSNSLDIAQAIRVRGRRVLGGCLGGGGLGGCLGGAWPPGD